MSWNTMATAGSGSSGQVMQQLGPRHGGCTATWQLGVGARHSGRDAALPQGHTTPRPCGASRRAAARPPKRGKGGLGRRRNGDAWASGAHTAGSSRVGPAALLQRSAGEHAGVLEERCGSRGPRGVRGQDARAAKVAGVKLRRRGSSRWRQVLACSACTLEKKSRWRRPRKEAAAGRAAASGLWGQRHG